MKIFQRPRNKNQTGRNPNSQCHSSKCVRTRVTHSGNERNNVFAHRRRILARAAIYKEPWSHPEQSTFGKLGNRVQPLHRQSGGDTWHNRFRTSTHTARCHVDDRSFHQYHPRSNGCPTESIRLILVEKHSARPIQYGTFPARLAARHSNVDASRQSSLRLFVCPGKLPGYPPGRCRKWIDPFYIVFYKY